MKKLTNDEISFIVNALQAQWYDAVQKLEGKYLGDIERENYEYIKDRSKALILKLDK